MIYYQVVYLIVHTHIYINIYIYIYIINISPIGKKLILEHKDWKKTKIKTTTTIIIIIIYKIYIAPYTICTKIALRRFTNNIKCKTVLH